MNDRQLSRARSGRERIILDAPADAAVRRRLYPPPPPYAEIRRLASQRANRTLGWSLVRILCAVAVVVGVQILICLDGGIVFDFSARPILGFGHHIAHPGMSAIALDVVPSQTAHRAAHAPFADVRIRPAVLIRVADAGQTADRAARHAIAEARPVVALPDIIIPIDHAITPGTAVPLAAGNASRKAAEALRSPPERIMQTPLDRLGPDSRHAVLLGLFLLSASDPRLRFGY